MLWYKAWLETRSRFLVALCGSTALCAYHVYAGNREALPDTALSYYNHVLHSGHAELCLLWVLSVTLLIMGGLLREKAAGAAALTLSLPVSRTRLMAVRICVGLIQAIALAIFPWCAMLIVATATGKCYSVSQAWFHVVLLLGGGLIVFGIALLVSSFVEGEYTAPIVSLGIVLAMGFLFADRSPQGTNPIVALDGFRYLDRSTHLLVGPIPWMRLATNVCITAALILASLRAMNRREF
jgi:hypothetical protein